MKQYMLKLLLKIAVLCRLLAVLPVVVGLIITIIPFVIFSYIAGVIGDCIVKETLEV